MIKVLQFIHGLNTGGAETLVKNYSDFIDKSKFDVTVLCIEHFEDSPYEVYLKKRGVKVIYLCDEMRLYGKKGTAAKFINHYQLYVLIRRYIRQLEPDVIHVHLELNHYIKFARPKSGTKIVYTQHFALERLFTMFSKQVKYLKWIIKNYPTTLIALNQKMKQEMIDKFRINNVVVINNGIDLERYHSGVNREEKRKELGLSKDAFIIVHVGRFNKIKNHDFLVEVFAEIKKKKEEAFLLMIGSGPIENSIREKLERLNLQEDSLILNNRMDVPEILLAADAAIFPSFSEGLGIAVIEMQAAGLPVVSSNGVPRDTQISNYIEYMDLSETPDKWADVLFEMLNSKKEFIFNGKDWNIRQNVKILEKIYEEN